MTRYTPLWLQSGSYAASVDRRLPGALWPSGRVDGMAVSVATGTTVNVAAGNAAVPTPNNTGSTLCVSDATEQVVLPVAPAAGLNRIDVVLVRPRGTDLDGGVNNDFIFDYVSGAEAASAVAPATPPGTVALANVTRPGGSAAIVAGNVADVRPGTLTIPSPFTPVHFRVPHDVQSIPRNAWTTITAWRSPSENVGGGTWNGATGMFTVPATGRYLVIGGVLWQMPTTTGQVGFQSQVAGNPGTGGPFAQDIRSFTNPSAANVNTGPTAAVWQRNAGDTVFLQGYNSHPSAAVSTYGGYFGLEVHRVE